jgi:hypothetical protein
MSKDLFNSLINEINAGNMDAVESKIGELTEEQIDALFGETQPYKSLGTASSNKIVIGAVSNLREKYLKKLTMTAMVGFLFQMKDEFTVDPADLAKPVKRDDFMEDAVASRLPENYNAEIPYYDELAKIYNARFPDETLTNHKEMEAKLSEDDLLEASTKANAFIKELSTPERVFNSSKFDAAVDAAVTEQSATERQVINKFLEWLFKYDADRDVQQGNNEIVDDPERTPLEELKGTDVVYDNVPSNDTHCRFTSFYDINYEKMREATENIYNIKPDLEHAMIVYDVADSQTEVESFIHKYGATSKYDIVTFPLNRWTFMGPFKENRARIDYYNKHNAIIKSMLEAQETDAALGEDLMKKRVQSKKVKAEKIFGKDSPEFENYKKMNPSELESKFNAKVETLDNGDIKVTRDVLVDAASGKEMKVDDDGVPLDALEIPITRINAKTGESTQTRIFSASEKS